MQLDKELAKELRIPTTGMESFNIIRYQDKMLPTGQYDELKSARAYRENGMLHHDHNESVDYVYFIQREDGQIFVGAAPNGIVHFGVIKEHLDPDIKADVIRCAVPARYARRFGCGYLNPKYGPLEFLAQHHPSQKVRIKVTAMLYESAEEQEQCEPESQQVH